MNTLWQLYLFYGILVGAGIANIVPVTSLVARWYGKRRGLMTGITLVGASFGAIIAPPITTLFLFHYGWRTSYVIVGGIVLVIVAISAILLRDPDKVRRPIYMGPEEKEKPHPEIRRFGLEQVLSTSSFWILGLILFCATFAQQVIMVHIVPHAIDLGISAVSAASILSVINAASILGALGTGSFSDRIGSRLSIVIALAMTSAATLLLLKANEMRAFYLFAIILGIGYGGTTTLRSTMIADLFGLRSHGVITGALLFVSTIGGTVGPLVAGYIFDASGQYQLAFLVITGLCIVGLALALLLWLRTARFRQGV
jgi:MFS family permease